MFFYNLQPELSVLKLWLCKAFGQGLCSLTGGAAEITAALMFLLWCSAQLSSCLDQLLLCLGLTCSDGSRRGIIYYTPRALLSSSKVTFIKWPEKQNSFPLTSSPDSAVNHSPSEPYCHYLQEQTPCLHFILVLFVWEINATINNKWLNACYHLPGFKPHKVACLPLYQCCSERFCSERKIPFIWKAGWRNKLNSLKEKD